MKSMNPNNIPGGIYYFSLALQEGVSINLVDHIAALKKSIQTVKYHSLFKLLAFAFLPDRVHVIWQMPEYDSDHYSRWKSITNLFIKSLLDAGVAVPINGCGNHQIWQDDYEGYALNNKQALKQHMDFIHISPVKSSSVKKAVDWPHSSIHHYANTGRANG